MADLFQLFEPFLPVFRLLISQDRVQNLGGVGVQLGPSFADLWFEPLVEHHLSGPGKALFELMNDVGSDGVIA